MTAHREATEETGGWELGLPAIGRGNGGSEGIIKSFTRRNNRVAQYIATRPMLDLCERSTRLPGAKVSWRWWEQAGIKLEGSKKRAAEAVAVSESESDSDLNVDPGREEELRGASGSSGAEWSGEEV